MYHCIYNGHISIHLLYREQREQESVRDIAGEEGRGSGANAAHKEKRPRTLIHRDNAQREDAYIVKREARRPLSDVTL